jgi:hypothetical protein
MWSGDANQKDKRKTLFCLGMCVQGQHEKENDPNQPQEDEDETVTRDINVEFSPTIQRGHATD